MLKNNMEKLKNSYVLKEFIINFIFTFFLFSLLFSIEGLFRIMELIVRRTFSPLILLKLFSISLLATFPYVIPLTFLCATMALFTRLSTDREILIFSSSGINPAILLRKLVILSTVISLCLFYFNFYLLPIAKYNRRKIIQELKFINPLLLFQEKTSVNDIPGATIYIEKIGPDWSLKNIVISYTDKKDKINFLKAKDGKATYSREKNSIIFSLGEGLLLNYSLKDVESLVKLKFSSYNFVLPLPEYFKRGNIKPKLTEMTLFQMKKVNKGIEERIEMNKRLLFAVTPILFVFFGFCLGMRLRQKSRSLNLGIGVLTSLSFFEFLMLGEILSRKTMSSGFIWLPAVVFILGIRALWK